MGQIRHAQAYDVVSFLLTQCRQLGLLYWDAETEKPRDREGQGAWQGDGSTLAGVASVTRMNRDGQWGGNGLGWFGYACALYRFDKA